ncbi:three-helix bundle dimerization domain-containing protein [Nocardia sp. CA-128927]|uniref:three-helix bundle dimerization domain-containing protein n=1 Tax=Nocardia sp. CA-128927 TaxID=3239975 RepID=UPI003D98D081
MANDETHQINEVVQRLARRYPQVAPDRVEQIVHDAQQRFLGRPIRDFIPLFVERIANGKLATPAL